MTINFISNDPGVRDAATIKTAITREPMNNVAFTVRALPDEDEYAEGTSEFVAWQAREAAVRALTTYEAAAGPLLGWAGSSRKKKLKLVPIAGEDLNAYYDRSSVSFFKASVGATSIFSGASTDVVAHEVGHAILDAIRPDLWNALFFEVQAFHEGFGDCVSIMTALADRDIRNAVLSNDAKLAKPNFAEAIAEQLSEAIGKLHGKNHNAAAPRRALNSFKWQFSTSLPDAGKAGVMINEIHSFGQLTSGCYYDLIRQIFTSGSGGEAELWKACETATKILVEGVKSAQIDGRFLEAVGRSMLLYDQASLAAKHQSHIKSAFRNHGIELSVVNMLAPRTALTSLKNRKSVSRGKVSSRRSLSASVRGQLHSVFDAPTDAALTTRNVLGGDRGSLEVTALRSIDLGSVDPRLKNVKTLAPQVALVGEAGGATAVLGAVDTTSTISQEVFEYTRYLLERDLVQFSGRAGSGTAFVPSGTKPTYRVRDHKGELRLERVRFSCKCHDR